MFWCEIQIKLYVFPSKKEKKKEKDVIEQEITGKK